LVFGLEFAAIAAAVLVLVRLGLQSSISSVVALIAGVHFFPLAELFEARAYHLTGAVLCALALVAFLLAPESRLALVGMGSAATLFASSAYMLFVGAKATRSQGSRGVVLRYLGAAAGIVGQCGACSVHLIACTSRLRLP
jgi:hypothetical protein